MVWYSHLLKNFPQFVVIHTVKGHKVKCVVNKTEVDVFLELSCFFNDPMDVETLIFGSSAFSKSIVNIWNFKKQLDNMKVNEESEKVGLNLSIQRTKIMASCPITS